MEDPRYESYYTFTCPMCDGDGVDIETEEECNLCEGTGYIDDWQKNEIEAYDRADEARDQ
jgi:RecJ-like exonuclease